MEPQKQEERAYIWRLYLKADEQVKLKVVNILKRKTMKYSIKTGILKIIKYFVIFAIPFLVDKFIIAFPELAQLSLGALLVGIVNFIKIKYA